MHVLYLKLNEIQAAFIQKINDSHTD